MYLTLKEIERNEILARTEALKGNRLEIAKSLGISVSGLDNKRKHLGIQGEKRRRGGSIEAWTEEVRKLGCKNTTEWRQKDVCLYNYMSSKGLITLIANALGLEKLKRGRPSKAKKGEAV